MTGHQEIDQRSLRMALAVATKIDCNPELLEQVRTWAQGRSEAGTREWLSILRLPWSEIRAVLLQDDEEGRRLRQSSPFVGILTAPERWTFYRE